MEPKFIHLRVHTEYSLIDGTVRIKPLIERVAELGMPAVAVTDQANLFALVKFYRAALAAGVKPIAGVDVLIRNEADPGAPFPMTLFVQNGSGYRRLTELISRAYLEGQHQGVAMLYPRWLDEGCRGLIALSGGREGDIGKALLGGDASAAEALLDRWLQLFDGRFYLELQRTQRPGEEAYIDGALALASKFGVPVAATNDVRFLHQSDFEAHEARVCIHQGRVLEDSRRPKSYSEMQYLRSQEEMEALFEDIPEALENTVEIAKRCSLELTLGRNFLPDFPVPEGMTTDSYFVESARRGLQERLRTMPPKRPDSAEDAEKFYGARLEQELAVIRDMGFAGYFLIVADFIQWAKAHAIPVGPGRGSGAGSLVAYALKITDLDPIQFDLLFERFLNPERVSMPDFDIDFCMERRDRVIDYVAERYGRDRVSQIITYGSLAARAVVRDIGRVLGHSYGFVDKLAKLIPFEIGMTLDKALDDSEELAALYASDEDVQTLINLAKSLEGIARNAGKHAGGVVISPKALTEFTPLYCEQGGGNVVTQFDKDDVEAVGLVKFDFLGLRTLTVIDWSVETVNRQRRATGEAPLDIARIPLDDVPTYELLKRCATTAVFQLESRGIKDLIRRLLPDCFEDIIALVALFRPGPLQSGMVDDYISVKHGKRRADYPHPKLEPILKGTNGVILYQEQVMQIARELAGYTLGGADLLRRAMGKKKPEEMAKQRAVFTEGAVARGVAHEVATHIFDLMEKFAGYGFNKSHSAAYALVAYQTAWLKTHHPDAFMAAALSADMDNTDKVVVLIEECRDMALAIVPPNVNRSEYRFTVGEQGEIVYGLGAIKGAGQAAIDALLRERKQRGEYRNLLDLCCRLDPRKIGRRLMEALIQAGAMDVFGGNRAAHAAALGRALKIAEQRGEMQRAQQDDLFGLSAPDADEPAVDSADAALDPWTGPQRLALEKATLGFYLSGHPIDEYESELGYLASGSIKALLTGQASAGARARVAGLIAEVRSRQGRDGKRMAFAVLDDCTARMEIAVFPESYSRCKELLRKDILVIAEGVLDTDDFTASLRLRVERLLSIEEARARSAKRLTIAWRGRADASKPQPKLDFIDELKALIKPYRGGACPVCIDYRGRAARTQVVLGEPWRVHPGDELLNRLRGRLGSDNIKVDYV